MSRDLEKIQTEEDLKVFLNREDTKEGDFLEFKLKPNYPKIKDIENSVKASFTDNIKKTICALANGQGGCILIGVDNEKNALGLDKTDISDVEERITSSRIARLVEDYLEIKLKNERNIIKILVKGRKPFAPVIFLNGVIYMRREDKSEPIQSQADLEKIYKRDQFYLFYIEGIKSTIEEFKNEETSLQDVEIFINGLKKHIEKKLTEYTSSDNIEKLSQTAENIKKYFQRKKTDPKNDPKKENVKPEPSLEKLVDEFCKLYENILKRV